MGGYRSPLASIQIRSPCPPPVKQRRLNYDHSTEEFEEENSQSSCTSVSNMTTTETDPDCPRKKPGSSGQCFPKKITRKVEKSIIHEDYKTINGGPINDIALLRLAEPVPFYSTDPTLSGAEPVCLPWDSENAGDGVPGRNLEAKSLPNLLLGFIMK